MTDTDSKGYYSRGYLPHLDAPGRIQMVTYRLADAIPDRRDPSSNLDEVLDRSYGECLLARPACAAIVAENFVHHDGTRYRLHAWVVMPNHVHVVLEPLGGMPLYEIVKLWKTWTARGINRLIGRSGTVWQKDYFDRVIRDDRHLALAVRYVEHNPAKAGLVLDAEDWEWSSLAMKSGPAVRGPNPRAVLRFVD